MKKVVQGTVTGVILLIAVGLILILDHFSMSYIGWSSKTGVIIILLSSYLENFHDWLFDK